MEKPKLVKAKYIFEQEGNCNVGGYEEIKIQYESDLGVDNTDGGFFVIKTKSWSVNSAEDIDELFKRIESIMKKNDRESERIN